MVRLRLKRFGTRHKPFYRIVAIDKRSPRDGEAIERLGYYDPCHKDESKQINLNAERINYWLGVGAQPTHTVAGLLKKNGIEAKGS